MKSGLILLAKRGGGEPRITLGPAQALSFSSFIMQHRQDVLKIKIKMQYSPFCPIFPRKTETPSATIYF